MVRSWVRFLTCSKREPGWSRQEDDPYEGATRGRCPVLGAYELAVTGASSPVWGGSVSKGPRPFGSWSGRRPNPWWSRFYAHPLFQRNDPGSHPVRKI